MLHRRGRYSTVDRNHPEAAGVCDRGGEVQKRRDLLPEMRWSGGKLVATGFLSCLRHMDIPNPQFGGQRPLPRDPVPVRNPRPPDGATSFPLAPSADLMRYADGSLMVGADGAPLLSFDDPLAAQTAGDLIGADGLPMQDAIGRPLGLANWMGL